MKKVILFFILINFSFINVNASIIVMDHDTNRVLYEKDAYSSKLIASTTKILTALLVIKYSSLNEIIKIDNSILKSTGSSIYLSIDEKIKIEDLLYGLLLRSGNDAAIALSNYIGDDFVNLMNDYAKSIGMNNSNFINPSGLENNLGIGNTSTAYDMALLMSNALNNSLFVKIIGTKKYIAKSNIKTYEWINKNKLLFNYKYLIGGKTGYTKKAHRTLVTSAKKDGKTLIIVTLNEVDDFNLHKKLYEKYFNDYEKVKILDKNLTGDLYMKNDIYMLLNKNEKKNIKSKIIYTNDIVNRYGYVEVSLDNKVYIKENIYKNIYKKKSFFKCIKDFIFNLF